MHMDAILERTFFEYIFLASSSALPIALWNALLILPASLLANGLHWYFGISADPSLLTPLSLLVGLMLSSRISEAYGKYRRAYDIFNKLDVRVSQCIQRLVAYTPRPRRDESEVVALRETLRRHLVLACCLMMQSLREHKHLEELRLFPGLLTAEEVEVLSTQAVSYSPRDLKQDRFPSRNRPALVFLWLHETVAELAVLLKMTAPQHTGMDGLVSSMANLFQEAEALARIGMPPPYAQINRLAVLMYLLLLPFALAQPLGMLLVPAMTIANVIYFGIERCANMMDNPFGDDSIDVDLEKMLRRIDKHSSALIGASTGKRHANLDLFPEARHQNELTRLHLHHSSSSGHPSPVSGQASPRPDGLGNTPVRPASGTPVGPRPKSASPVHLL
tara:strand:- start:351 stop:1520 length:1170 start_codon:yes stop_codon:yes gene_type:complete